MEINDDVIDQLASVRQSGAVNMFDKNGVQVVAHEFGHHQLVVFIEEASSAEYMEALETMGNAVTR